MSKRSRERQLAKLAARRQAERDAQRHRRQRSMSGVGAIVGVAMVATLGLFFFNRKDAAQPSATPTASPSAVVPVACGGSVPDAAGQTKPTFKTPPPMTIDPSKTYTATMRTSCGKVVLELDPGIAPIGVNSFVFLAKRGFYDGLTFQRILKGFVIQGGDPKGDGTGGPGYQFKTETTPTATFDGAGILAYANSGPDTNGSQFFITLAPTPNLNPSTSGSYTIFGKVVQGLDVVQAIGSVPVTANPSSGETSAPTQTVYIERVTISVGP